MIPREAVTGQSITELPQEKWPCCVPERVAFMSPLEYIRITDHPYKQTSEMSHGHFDLTALRHPAYSAPAVPFAWLLREVMGELGETRSLDVQAEREPELGFTTSWIQDWDNQRALLDYFCNQLVPEQSLCFFYFKQIPFVVDAGAAATY